MSSGFYIPYPEPRAFDAPLVRHRNRGPELQNIKPYQGRDVYR